jgi:mono/diheme cytochrome c family protein
MAAHSRHRRSAGLLGLLALCVATFTLSACGGGSRDLANGKAKFAACGSCHTLADAGTKGTVGPNLDDAFRGSREQGFEKSSFEGIIRYWIEKPEQRSQPIMPPNIVTGKDADDVAAYIASVAGAGDAESPARPAEEFK